MCSKLREALQGLIIDSEWNHSEKNGGKTFMGDVISGVTRALVDTQNKVLYGKDDEQK